MSNIKVLGQADKDYYLSNRSQLIETDFDF